MKRKPVEKFQCRNSNSKTKIVTQVCLRQIRKSYADGTEVIPAINLAIEEGKFLVFVGFSGCGKPTLLCMIAG